MRASSGRAANIGTLQEKIENDKEDFLLASKTQPVQDRTREELLFVPAEEHPFEKKIEDKMAPVDGRLEMRRKQTTGEPYVFSDVKFKELNLERPIYGLKLDENQKNKLEKTGELGLVSGFKTTEGKDYNLWVSLDTKLNKVVTKRENDIYIDKIFGATPTEEQKNKIKSGEGALIEIKDKKYFIQASAATTKVDGLKSYTEEKAKEFKLISEDTKEEKKNSKTKGMKV